MPFFYLFTLVTAFFFWQTNSPELWYVKSNSQLTVNGSTNINTFSCLIPSYGKTDTLVYFPQTGLSNRSNVNCILHIPVLAFDCGNRFMTKDLQKTMHAEKFPFLVIDIKTLAPFNGMSGKNIEGKTQITIAGVSKSYFINFTVSKIGQNYMLKGKKSVLFSDFKLHPPSKLGGSIRVNDALDVEVNLVLVKGS